jgi:hypothetical protein
MKIRKGEMYKKVSCDDENHNEVTEEVKTEKMGFDVRDPCAANSPDVKQS